MEAPKYLRNTAWEILESLDKGLPFLDRDLANQVASVLKPLPEVVSSVLETTRSDSLAPMLKELFDNMMGLKNALVEISRTRYRIRLGSGSPKKTAENYLMRIETCVSALKVEATASSRDEARQLRDTVLRLTHDKEQKALDIMRRLLPACYNENLKAQAEYAQYRLPGSGTWFLASGEYRDWSRCPGATLFAPGIPGSGKSTMTSIVIDHLRSQFGADASIAWFYFSRLGLSLTEGDLIATLAAMLLNSTYGWSDQGVASFMEEQMLGERSNRAKFDSFISLLGGLGAPHSRIFLLFDGVDEAPEDVRGRLIPRLQDLQDSLNLTIFATARLGTGVSELFSRSTSLEVRATTEDISAYLRSAIDSDRRLRRLLGGEGDEEMREKIISSTIQKCHGMFLFARLTLKALENSVSRRTMLEVLEDTRRVDMLYESLVMELQSTRVLQAVFRWLTLGKQPLPGPALQHAINTFEEDIDISDENLPDLDRICARSAGLLVSGKGGDADGLRFCHWTAADFFRRGDGVLVGDWRLAMARACVRYINLPAFATGPLETDERYQRRLDAYPFYEYASKYWAAHLKDAGEFDLQSPLWEPVFAHLNHSASVASSAQALMAASHKQPGFSQHAPSDLTALSLVAYLDLPDIASVLIGDVCGIAGAASVDAFGRTPLAWSVCGGSLATVQLLLHHECDVNWTDREGETAVSLAAFLGHARTVQVLLGSGADPNRDNGCEGGPPTKRPLIAAAERGHTEIVHLLIEHGADTGYSAENGDSALHRAAANGHAEVVDMLCSALRIDVQIQNQHGQTPLYIAAANGHTEVVKVLLAAGADAKIADRDGQSPLLRAALNQHGSVMEAILASGLDVGGCDYEVLLAMAIESEGWGAVDMLLRRGDAGLPSSTPGHLLCQAARGGEKAMVERLAERYPDAIEMTRDDLKLTPLAWAAQEGHVEVVQILLQHGANVNARDKENKTPVMRSIESGKQGTTAILLAVGSVDIGCGDSGSTTLLSLASRMGQARTVESLLERQDVDPDAADGSGRTPLSLAAESGHVDTVRELLKSGRVSLTLSDLSKDQNPLFWAIHAGRSEVVDLLAKRDDVASFLRNTAGQTALSFACERGVLPAVKALLGARGIYPDIADLDGRTPLCWAADEGHDAIVKLLLAVKADRNAKTRIGWTPLHFAARSGRESVINALLPLADANAMAEDGTTPLVVALRVDAPSQETIRTLLQYDYMSLHEQLHRGDSDMVKRLLNIGYKVDTRDMWGQTPLHSVVTASSNRLDLARILIASNPRPDLDIEDTNGLTPLRLALKMKEIELVDLLLKSSARVTPNISTQDWLQAYDKSENPPPIIRMLETEGEGTTVEYISYRGFNEDALNSTISVSILARRQFIFTKPLDQFPRIPSYPELPKLDPGQLSIKVDQLRSPSGGVHFSVALYFPSLGERATGTEVPGITAGATNEGAVMMIRWTVAKRTGNSKTGKGWSGVHHFSTLTNGCIPDHGAEFFKQFLDQLRTRWLRTCKLGDELLEHSRKQVLRNGGQDPKLIQRLRTDAGVWIDLQAEIKGQIEVASGFRSKYLGLDSDQGELNKVTNQIEELAVAIGTRLQALGTKSQELIQIEFNLTSIAEAKHSTSTNNSMKRLTWITFIFLPLTFISTLFGMNVDVLEPPPPWWWYLPLALGTMSLTFSIWIVFKRNNDLESNLENKFTWLLRAKEDRGK